MAHQISRQSIFEIWIVNSKQTRIDAIVAYILQKLDDSSLPNNVITSIKITVRGFCQKLEQRWNKADHNRERFLSANSLWLQENIVLSDVVIEAYRVLLKVAQAIGLVDLKRTLGPLVPERNCGK